MQLPFDIDDHGRTLRDIHSRLRQRFGRQGPNPLLGPVSPPVMAMIGGRTPETVTKSALRHVTDAHGGLTLANLHDLSVVDALAWQEELPGVGRKSSAVVLNFSRLQRRALVIDTHHLRVLRRRRLVGWRCNTVKVYDWIVPLLPADWSPEDMSEHHQRVKALGQQICRHAAPMCEACPLTDLCAIGRSRRRHRSQGTADDLCHGCGGDVAA